MNGANVDQYVIVIHKTASAILLCHTLLKQINGLISQVLLVGYSINSCIVLSYVKKSVSKDRKWSPISNKPLVQLVGHYENTDRSHKKKWWPRSFLGVSPKKLNSACCLIVVDIYTMSKNSRYEKIQ